MSYPSLSIVIPSFNRPDLLRQTLASITAQTLLPENLEVVVSDDGSGPECEKVARSFENILPVKIFVQPKSLGANANIAFLLEKAEGELVFLLCDDDLISPKFIETHLNAFKRYPHLDMSVSNLEILRPEGACHPLRLSTPVGLCDGDVRAREQLRSHHMVIPTVYRRELLLNSGGWDVRAGGHLDCTAFCRAALRSRVTLHTEEPLVRFRVSAHSWGVSAFKSEADSARWYRYKLDKLRQDARMIAPREESFYKRAYRTHARMALSRIEVAFANGKISGTEARRSLLGLLSVFPAACIDRNSLKLLIVSFVGTAWLAKIRKILGKKNPYASDITLFWT